MGATIIYAAILIGIIIITFGTYFGLQEYRYRKNRKNITEVIPVETEEIMEAFVDEREKFVHYTCHEDGCNYTATVPQGFMGSKDVHKAVETGHRYNSHRIEDDTEVDEWGLPV